MSIKQRRPNGTFSSNHGDRPKERYCPSCRNYFPKDNFYKDLRGVNGLTRRCRQCHSRKSYASRMKRPEIKSERYESLRKWMLNKKYKLTPEEYKRILDEQKGVCKICGKKQEKWWISELNGGLSIDHHHSCGRVRGLLCSNCNTAIGLLCEDTKIMRRAIQYIKNSCCDDATINP